MKIKTKLFITTIISVLVITLFGIYTTVEFTTIHHINNEIEEANHISVAALDFNVENFHTQLEVWEYAYEPNQKRLAAFEAHRSTLDELLIKWQNLVLEAEESVGEDFHALYDGATNDINTISANLELVEKDWNVLLVTVGEYATAVDEGASNTEIEQLDLLALQRVEINEDLFDELQFNKKVDQFVINQEVLLNALEAKRDKLELNFVNTLYVVIPIVVGISVIISVAISRSVSKSIEKLKSATLEITKGNFDVETKIISNDEIGELTSQFDVMKHSIKKSNLALSKSEQKYKDLYENSPDLYRTINTDGIILNCNESYAKSLGYTKEEVIGKSIFEHIIPSEKMAMCDSFITWKDTGRVLNRNVIFKRKDGSSFPVVVSASNLYDEKGKLIGSNTIIRNMSELRDAEKRVEYEKLKRLSTIGELTARVSHDLLNPLTVIKNTLFSLQLKPKLDQETKKEYQRLERAVIRMTHQIEDVLDYVKTKPLKLKTNSLLEILQLSLQRIRVPSDVIITIPKNDVKIISDSEKLEVVFVNLIGNAIQAMNKGNIDIRFTEEDKFILIEVEDSGIGIPKELLSKIFDPLFTTREVGTGLGLVSCKNIIKKHNGTIEVDTVIGTGTTFKIRLPKVLKEIVQR